MSRFSERAFSLALTTFSRKSMEYGSIADLLLNCFIVPYLTENHFISAVRRFDYLVQAVKRGGPHKILFGSDGPWLHPGLELQKIRLLGLPPEREALILGENLLRLIAYLKLAH